MKYPKIRRILEHRRLPILAVLLGTLLVLPSLNSGLILDDYCHQHFLSTDKELGGLKHGPLDLFTFVSGDPEERRNSMEAGIYPWWTAEDLKLSFFRPLSSLSHLADHHLWINSPVLKHLHSILWYLLLLVLVAVMYRRFHTKCAAGLALLLFAIDDAHGLTVGFIANRNAIIAAVFGIAALIAYDRSRRDNWSPGRFLSPIFLAFGLLAGEACLAVTGYLFAYALFIDRGTVKERSFGLLPHVLVCIVWMVVYISLGYGTHNSGIYVNPIGEPMAFLPILAKRLPVLLLGQFGFPPSDFWLIYPPQMALFVLIFAVLAIGVFILVLLPFLRKGREKPTRDRRVQSTTRFWALGTLLAILPVCATFPSDRNLLISGIGAMGLLAILLGSPFEKEKTNGQKKITPWVHRFKFKFLRLAGGTAIGILIIIHLVLAPLMRPFRSLTWQKVSTSINHIDENIPGGEAIRGKTLVIVNFPLSMFVMYVPFYRWIRGEEIPGRIRLLAAGTGRIEVIRVSDRVLRIRTEQGFLRDEWEQMFRGPNTPMPKGYTVTLRDMQVKVTGVTGDGLAAEAEFYFNVPLEDSSLCWMYCSGGIELTPYTPPKIGEKHYLKTKINLLKKVKETTVTEL